ncbi:MAG: AAA family ATPase [Spirochaetales bacterium]|nr:AAA family ATPase [Spirochaetales bacterium]
MATRASGKKQIKKTYGKKRKISYLTETELRTFHGFVRTLIDNLEQVIRGKRPVLEYLVTALIAGGHVLIEDVPGLGKTTLAKTLAHLISLSERGNPVVFKRIQFTPDLLPYDITGVDIYDQKNNAFVFSPGPAFANILLADEINRTTPKVQSALLEVMAENQITVGNRTHSMDPFFFVIATQNPVETEGTYPLPLAQIDRFLMKLHIGYPDEEVEINIVKDDPAFNIMPHITPVCGKEDILLIRNAVNNIYCDERLIRAAVNISAATRKHRGIELGASPRASLMLVKAARAYALVKGRSYIIDQDLVDLAPLVISHRLRMKALKLEPEALIRELTLDALQKLSY